MSSDFSIAFGFASHRKILKLQRSLGPESVVALLTLWAHAAESKPSGSFVNVEPEDIAIAAQWEGDPEAFTWALVEHQLLDHDSGFSIHDWKDWNEFAATGKRKKSAKMMDFRVKCGFHRHPKIVKLKRAVGAAGVLSLIRLWGWTAENRPRGILVDLDETDIAIAAGWADDAQLFVTALTDQALLDRSDDNGYIVHDWPTHNPFAYGFPDRSEAARVKARIRWSRSTASVQPDAVGATSTPVEPPHQTEADGSDQADSDTVPARWREKIVFEREHFEDPEMRHRVAINLAGYYHYLVRPFEDRDEQNEAVAWLLEHVSAEQQANEFLERVFTFSEAKPSRPPSLTAFGRSILPNRIDE